MSREKKTSLAICLLTVVLGIFYVATAPAEAGAPDYARQRGPGGVDHIVDLQNEAQLFWNETLIPDPPVADSPFPDKGQYLIPLGLFPTFDTREKSPQDAFWLYNFDPYASSVFSEANQASTDGVFQGYPGNEVGLVWFKARSGEGTRALNGKEIVTLSFSGLPDTALSAAFYDGMIVKLPQEPGRYALQCEIKDNYGVVTQSGVMFEVLPFPA